MTKSEPRRADDKRVSKGRVPKKVAAAEAKGAPKPLAVVKPKRPRAGRPKKVK